MLTSMSEPLDVMAFCVRQWNELAGTLWSETTIFACGRALELATPATTSFKFTSFHVHFYGISHIRTKFGTHKNKSSDLCLGDEASGSAVIKTSKKRLRRKAINFKRQVNSENQLFLLVFAD